MASEPKSIDILAVCVMYWVQIVTVCVAKLIPIDDGLVKVETANVDARFVEIGAPYVCCLHLIAGSTDF